MEVIKTHDLDALLEKLGFGEDLGFENLDLTWLTEWSVESRYPGDWPEASRKDAQRAVNIATEIIGICQKYLAK